MIPILVLVLKVAFAVGYIIISVYMANYLMSKSSSNVTGRMAGIIATIGTLLTGQVYISMAYSAFKLNENTANLMMGISRMIFAMFFVMLPLLSYYMYVVSFNKRRYQKQLIVVLVFALLATLLTVMPQNDYRKAVPGMLLPHLRTIVTVLFGLYVGAIILMDGYYKRNILFQRFALVTVLIQAVNFINTFVLRVKAENEFFVFVAVDLLFMVGIRMFYKELYVKHVLDRY